MFKKFNTRILVIDDEETIRDSFREILIPDRSNHKNLQELSDAAADLFGNDNMLNTGKLRSPGIIKFEISEASNGKDGFLAVKTACEEDRPYAAIFVDMRMPGWDGLETVIEIRKIDSRAEIVFVTAYSDHSVEEIVMQAGANVTYYCKPFSADEILQIATKTVYEWNKTRNLEELIEIFSQIRAQHWPLDKLLQNVLGQVSEILGCKSALLAIRRGEKYEVISATGILVEPEIAASYLASIPPDLNNQMYEAQGMLYFALAEYDIITLFERGNSILRSERIYLVRLFLEQAAAAIRNIDLEEALVRNEKISAVGQALSMVSHDLRNSIGIIRGMAEISLEELDNKTAVEENLKMIEKAADNGLEMVNDVLDFVRNNAVAKQDIHLNELISQVRQETQDLLKQSNVTIEINAPDDVLFQGDISKLKRVMLNLLRNAAEALADHKTQNPAIAVCANVEDKKLVIRVKDNGPGIPEEIKDKLFMPFTTCGKSGGTGLGLAIAQQFIQAHGGSISVDSSDAGTEFKITLPLD
ncbi:MAG: sensor histidine kinase [Victivallaceae bacterium]